MKGEFSRLSFDPRQHYAGVLQQQGRVGLDSDWNEWVEIVLRRIALLTRDVVGGCGRPKHAPGFEISIDTAVTPPDLLISDGRLYAGGMLAESESPAHKGTLFSQQTDWPFPTKTAWTTAWSTLTAPAWPGIDFSTLAAGSSTTQLIYAEVWLRHLTALNDEAARDEAYADAAGNPNWTTRPEVGDLIRERALGGPDTCTRLQTVAQVKHWDNLPSTIQTCEEACAALAKALPPKTIGTMQLDVTPTPPVTDPCQEPLEGGYGGAWNRTYRVEIHDPGPAGTATFKWSTENGAFAVRINGTAMTAVAAASDIVITSIGNDQETELSANDWVEVCGEETELGVFRNALAQVAATPTSNPDGTWTIQLTGAVMLPHAPFLRRWSANTQTITLNTPFNLDAGSGLAVTFFDATGGHTGATNFHILDYWTWSARTDIRAVEPQTLANVPQPPQGIERHYCCLALLTWQNQSGSIVNTANTPCTPVFPPITCTTTEECGCCCVISVGDGVLSHGDYDSLTDAFAALPDTGKRGAIVICIEEGIHQLPSPITLTQDRVIIRGCGPNTLIEAPQGAFILNNRRQVTFSDLVIESQSAPAITAYTTRELVIRDSRIRMSLSQAAAPAPGNHPIIGKFIGEHPALLLQGWLIEVLHNEIRGSTAGGGIALLPSSGDVTIAGNNIHKSVLPGVDFSYALVDSNQDWLPIRLNTSGASFESIAIRDNSFRDINAQAILQDTALASILYPFVPSTAASTPAPTAKSKKAAAEPPPPAANQAIVVNPPKPTPGLILDLSIERNLITRCGLGSTIDLQGESDSAQKASAKSAILTIAPEAAIQLSYVERLLIAENRIVKNGERNPAYAGVRVDLSQGAILRDNVISENGRLVKTPSVYSSGVVFFVALPELGRQRRESAADAEGWAALVVEENLIDSLNGPALKVYGLGAMRIRGNTLTNRQTSTTPASSTCLIVVNLGTAPELSSPYLPSGGYVVIPTEEVTTPSLLSDYGGLTMIADNQIVTVNDVKTVGYSAILLSLDDLSFTNNQVRIKSETEMIIDVIAVAFTLRIVGNRFSEPLQTSAISCFGFGQMVTGACNQATHCLIFDGLESTASDLNIVNPAFARFCQDLSAVFASGGAGATTGNTFFDPATQAENLMSAQQQTNRFQITTLDQAQTSVSQRAAQLAEAAKAPHAVPETKTRATLFQNLATALSDARLSYTNLPQPSADSFILHGRVVSAAGKGVAELSVSLSDPKGILNNRVAPVKTDTNGYFTMTLRAAEYPDLTAGTSQIFVSVTNAKQKEIAKPSQALTFQPGKVAIMPIVS